MGNQPPKASKKPVDMMDTIIQMKMNSKQIARAAKTSQKQSQKYMKKAKQALKKNNEEGAKLYLTSASSKRTQALNYQRTALKMQIMCDNVKSMQKNQQLIGTFNNMSQAVSQQMAKMDAVKMAESMGTLNEKMDEIMINNNMMNELMQQNDGVQSNQVADMMNVLKQEITMEETDNLGQDVNTNNQYNKANTNHNQQQQQVYGGGNSNNGTQNNSNNQPGGGEYHDPFLDELKDL